MVPPVLRPAAEEPGHHELIPIRFVDVLDELEAIATLLGREGRPDDPIVAACRRAQQMLLRLRRQFVEDVVHAGAAPAGLA
jgi:hypothetical protein